MSVAVVTDSTAYLSPEQVAEAAAPLAVVPLHVVAGGTERREGIDFGVAELSEALRRFEPVTTSRPAPEEFLEVYQRLAAQGATAIVSVHISADLSATVEGAQLAAARSPVPVTVVDSRVIGAAMGYAVLSGCAAAASGADAETVAAVCRSRSEEASVVFYVHTLEYLRRGGRIGSAAALLGTALAIKPILGLQDGRIVPVERVRTSTRALARMVELTVDAAERAADSGRPVDVGIQHLDQARRGEQLAAALLERIPGVAASGSAGAGAGEVRVGGLGAVVGAHVGPGTLAITVSPRPRR